MPTKRKQTRYFLPGWIMSKHTRKEKREIMKAIEREPSGDYDYRGSEIGSVYVVYDTCNGYKTNKKGEIVYCRSKNTFTFCEANLWELIMSKRVPIFECHKRENGYEFEMYGKKIHCSTYHNKTLCKQCWDAYFKRVGNLQSYKNNNKY